MPHLTPVLLLLVLPLAVAAAQEQPPSPAEQFQALRREADRASSSGRVLTDAERMKFIGQAYRRRFELAEKFLALAEKYPKDPIAQDALFQAVWQVNGTPWPVEMVGEDTARLKVFAILHRDHLQSEKLGPLCQRISYGFCSEYETFLRAVVLQNPHRPVQAAASLYLGRFLHNRLQRIDLCREQPELAKEFADLFGKDYIEKLIKQDRDTAVKEVEAVLEEAIAKFGDVTLPAGDTVTDRAKAELFEIRHLSVGKEAPDIEGVDQDGQRFHLRDYRGKVVLLDFFSYV